jgi:hypothetical protein
MTSGAPVTSSGNISLSFVNQSGRKVFAAPESGSGAPDFRLLRISDIFSTVGVNNPFLAASGSCPTGQMLNYVSATDTLTCTSYVLASDSVGNAQIANNAVTNTKIQNGAVTTDKIADGAVTASKLADLPASKITSGTVDVARLPAADGNTSDNQGGIVSAVTQAFKGLKTFLDGLQVGWTSMACTSSNQGSLRFNNTTKQLEVCNGLNWSRLPREASGIIFVDQENGNDANSGLNASEAVKTMQEAVNRIPEGTAGIIRLANHYNFGASEFVNIHYKRVRLELNGWELRFNDFTTEPLHSAYARRGAFILHPMSDLTVIIVDGKIILGPNSTGKSLSPYSTGVFQFSQFAMQASLFLYIGSGAGGNWAEVNAGCLVSVHEWSAAGGGLFQVGLYPHYNRTLQLNGSDTCFIATKGRVFSIYAAIGNNDDSGYIKRDTSPISLTDPTVVTGLVRDSNNVPRNVISNIVF